MAVPILSLAEANAWLKAHLSDLTVWMGWHNTDPTRLGDIGSEVSGGGYTRQRIIFSAPSGGAVSNTNSLIYSNMPAVTMQFLSIWSAQFNGTMKLYVPAAFVVPDSQQVLVSPGDVTVSL